MKIILPIKERTGKSYQSKNFGIIKIIEYFTSRNCTIQFEDGTILKNINYDSAIRGNVKNPNQKDICGVGYLGIGKYNKKDDKKLTTTFQSMFSRSYNLNQQKSNKSYMGSVVCEEWHNFQNFAQWFYENYNPETMEGWQLDKDILIKGNKIYSAETCCFVPSEINVLFIKSEATRGRLPIGVNLNKRRGRKYASQVNIDGKRIHLGLFDTPEEAFQAYKTAKEKYIKEKADKWKDKIHPKVYQALYNYQVEITD